MCPRVRVRVRALVRVLVLVLVLALVLVLGSNNFMLLQAGHQTHGRGFVAAKASGFTCRSGPST